VTQITFTSCAVGAGIARAVVEHAIDLVRGWDPILSRLLDHVIDAEERGAPVVVVPSKGAL
jgi:hypothetical protein